MTGIPDTFEYKTDGIEYDALHRPRPKGGVPEETNPVKTRFLQGTSLITHVLKIHLNSFPETVTEYEEVSLK